MDDLYNYIRASEAGGPKALPPEILNPTYYFPFKFVTIPHGRKEQYYFKKGSVVMRQNGDAQLEEEQPASTGPEEVGPGDFLAIMAYSSLDAAEKYIRAGVEEGLITEVQDLMPMNLYQFLIDALKHDYGIVVYSENRIVLLDQLEVLNYRHLCTGIDFEFVPVQFRDFEFVRSLDRRKLNVPKGRKLQIVDALKKFDWIDGFEIYVLDGKALGNQDTNYLMPMVDVTANSSPVSKFVYRQRLCELLIGLKDIVPYLGVTLETDPLEKKFELPPPADPHTLPSLEIKPGN